MLFGNEIKLCVYFEFQLEEIKILIEIEYYKWKQSLMKTMIKNWGIVESSDLKGYVDIWFKRNQEM